jgi:hypothetical protein
VGDLSAKQERALAQASCCRSIMYSEICFHYTIAFQFRQRVADISELQSHIHDDHYLSRWLRARNFDVSKSEKMIRQVGMDIYLNGRNSLNAAKRTRY